MEWDTPVVKGSLLLNPSGLGTEEPPLGPGLLSWLQPKRCAMFQCTQCHLCLLTWCSSPGTCCRVTNNVDLEAPSWLALKVHSKAALTTGGIPIGFHLYSTHAALRGHFWLSRDKIVCFLLKTKAIVNASEMDIHNMPLPEKVAEVKFHDFCVFPVI